MTSRHIQMAFHVLNRTECAVSSLGDTRGKMRGFRFTLARYTPYKSKGKVHPCTGTEALYRPYGP